MASVSLPIALCSAHVPPSSVRTPASASGGVSSGSCILSLGLAGTGQGRSGGAASIPAVVVESRRRSQHTGEWKDCIEDLNLQEVSFSAQQLDSRTSGDTALVKNAVAFLSAAAMLFNVHELYFPDIAFASPEAAGASAEQSSPYGRSGDLPLGLDNGRIKQCPTAINPNCVSTSSADNAYGTPWAIPERSLPFAVRKVESAVKATQKNAEVLASKETPQGHYLLMEVDGLFGRDTLEFLFKNDTVFYRAMAEKVIYVYPFQTPVGDFGAQRKRLEALQSELGWRRLGCDLIECYE